jgi:hypothetical protein
MKVKITFIFDVFIFGNLTNTMASTKTECRPIRRILEHLGFTELAAPVREGANLFLSSTGHGPAIGRIQADERRGISFLRDTRAPLRWLDIGKWRNFG